MEIIPIVGDPFSQTRQIPRRLRSVPLKLSPLGWNCPMPAGALRALESDTGGEEPKRARSFKRDNRSLWKRLDG